MQPSDGDRTRLNELYLYIAKKTRDEGHPGLGRIRVAKLLFLIDFGAYFRLGESITGARYIADDYGPAPVEELTTIRDLEVQERLRMEPGFDKQEIPVALKAARTEVFTEEQLDYIERIIERYRTFSGKQLVDVAHDYPGWVFARKHGDAKADVPLESVFWAKPRKLTVEEEAYASQLAEEFGLAANG